MSINVTVRIDPAGVAALAKLKQRLEPRAFLQVVFKLFDRIASRAAAYIIKTQLSGSPVKRRTGALAQGMVGRATMLNGVPGIRVGVARGPATKYAGVVDQGTQDLNPQSPYPVIKPVRARALAMPVDDALTPAGVAKYDGPRSYPGSLTFIPFRDSGVAVGALYDSASLAALRRATKGPIDLRQARRLYVLLRQASIPPTFFLRKGMEGFIPELVSELTAYLTQVFDASSAVA